MAGENVLSLPLLTKKYYISMLAKRVIFIAECSLSSLQCLIEEKSHAMLYTIIHLATLDRRIME